ncbi:uncharacterized protein V6R79_008685 [Siganus canaliculatus]
MATEPSRTKLAHALCSRAAPPSCRSGEQAVTGAGRAGDRGNPARHRGLGHVPEESSFQNTT